MGNMMGVTTAHPLEEEMRHHSITHSNVSYAW